MQNFKLANISNIVFIYPIIIAILGQVYLVAILNFGLLLASFYHHNSFEKKYVRFDMLFSWACIFYNLYLCYLFKFSILPFGTAFIFLIIGLYSYFKAGKNTKNVYQNYHLIWHLSCAAITTCCMLGYLFYI